MKKLYCTIFLIFGLTLLLHAQDENSFLFRDQLRDTASLRLDYSLMKSHFLGEEIARKIYRLERTYTYRVQPTAMSPTTKTEVKKPVIYYAVLKLNNHYRKQIKKSQITESEAISQLGEALDIAFMIFGQDTGEFEAYLKKNKSTQQIEKAFKKIELY